MSTTTKRKASLEDAWAAIEALVETQQKTETELAQQKTALARQKTEESLRESQKKTEEALKETQEYLQKLGENRTVYGGVAYFTIDDKDHTEKEIKEYIDEQGLFLIQSPKSEAKISTFVNGEGLKPKTF